MPPKKAFNPIALIEDNLTLKPIAAKSPGEKESYGRGDISTA